MLQYFINPWMLLGLFGLSLPVIAHLLSKRRYDVVHWGAMQFLELNPNTKRKLRLEQLLLLLLRMGLIALVVFAPVVETFIMAGFLSLFLRFFSPTVAILLSAAGWGIAHSLEAAGWGLVIWWPFLIFSTLFVVWRQRGFMTGIAVAATTHAIQNLGPALTVAYPQLFHLS